MKKWFFLVVWIVIIILSNLFKLNELHHFPRLAIEASSGVTLFLLYLITKNLNGLDLRF